ncbi:sugar ABC transporter ATP-binding protein [Actibacterium mucosum KCTC 23349]|uniref:Sugar ABC transporter ATP-binding protein n=1 Tax=Actibacterium mucosum KCTC 23349 TaxID=1454373 RepID=A0A037ZG98_9RHOB|nr:sugar ABC transporter ATP-binding protein [Actibacterium mucosum]KAJ55465.1 sugar ABC transporter ATP-binding protein [Actibacterium mucosum KCTC 23349]
MSAFVAMKGVSKLYGATKALTGVDFACEPGQIHAVLGENGAGKSTLMKLMSGVIQPTEGVIELNGTPVTLPSPRAAQAAGIVCMFQELSLAADLSVGENILLGAPGTGWGFLPRGRLARARKLLDRIGGEAIALGARIEALTLGERQQVEIVKALMRAPKLLILDEATSALTSTIVDKVFDVLRELKAQGVAILFISHRFHEVEAIADRVSVFRSGQHIDSFAAGSRSQAQIIDLMIGQPMDELFPPRNAGDIGDEVLKVEGLRLPGGFEDINLTARHGEIVGIGGLDGQGQGKFLQALFGIMKGVQGRIEVNGVPRSITSPRDAASAGIAFVPEDRKTEGLIPNMSIGENLQLSALSRFRGGLIGRGNGIDPAAYDALIAELELKFAGLDAPVSSLSGGNQQKVALIKWLALAPDCLLLLDPTRGIDVKTKAQIYRLMRRLSAQGMAVVLLSTDYDELVNLCDRVLVFYNGQIARSLSGDALTPEAVVAASMGVADAA